MQGIPFLTIRQANRLLSSGLVTSEQLYRYCYALAVAGEEVWTLRAFTRLVPFDDALELARLSDQRRSRGKLRSALDGIPISIKANIAVESLPLTAGSRILGATTTPEDCAPPTIQYNAAVTEALLHQSGCILVGQTSMDEFGMGSLGTNVPGGYRAATKNPRPLLHQFQRGYHSQERLSDEEVAKLIALPMEAIQEAHSQVLRGSATIQEHYSAGGSSCGSAASVAHGSSLLSIGTDTGGSVRLPAAWCGIVGYKPSYGVLSRHGLVSYASSLDTVGFLAPSADCAQLAFRRVVESQKTHQDATTTPFPLDSLDGIDPGSSNSRPLEGFRVGIPAAFSVVECPEVVRAAWWQTAQELRDLGASVEEVSTHRVEPRLLRHSLAAYYLLACAEASSNLARYDGVRYGTALPAEEDFDSAVSVGWSTLERRYAAVRSRYLGSEAQRRVLCGAAVLSSDRFHTHYEAAAHLRAALAQQLRNALEDCDVLLVPTAVTSPPSLSSPTAATDPIAAAANDVMTVAASLAGLPSLALPCGPLTLEGQPKSSSSAAALVRPSMQLIGGSRRGDAQVLRAALALEQNRRRDLQEV